MIHFPGRVFPDQDSDHKDAALAMSLDAGENLMGIWYCRCVHTDPGGYPEDRRSHKAHEVGDWNRVSGYWRHCDERGNLVVAGCSDNLLAAPALYYVDDSPRGWFGLLLPRRDLLLLD
jgi:hypothetical protein